MYVAKSANPPNSSKITLNVMSNMRQSGFRFLNVSRPITPSATAKI